MQIKYVVVIVLMIISATVGRYTVTASPKVIEKEHIVYKDRVVEKKVYVESTKKKNNKVTIKWVTIKPDGTKVIETKIYDKNEIEINKDEKDNKTVDTSTKQQIQFKKEDWLISVGLNNYHGYALTINRRIIGPVYLGIFGFSDLTYGLTVGASF